MTSIFISRNLNAKKFATASMLDVLFPLPQKHFILKDLPMKNGGNKLHQALFSSLLSEDLFCFHFDFT